jgi:hypothetical protein
MIFHDAGTPLCSTDYFSDTETPLCSTVHFSDAETPLKNTGDCFPNAETPLIDTFHFFPVTETFHSPHHSHSRNNSVQHLFRFFPSLCCNTIRNNFSPLPKHQQPFISPPVAETPIVSNFSSVSPDAETPLFSIFHPLPIIFLTHHHRRNNSVQQLFRLFCC